MLNMFDILCFFIVFILGICVGSFLNVCIYRIPKEESIVKPPSHCTSCNHRLGFLDLFPVFSYIFLGGKCRYCKEKYSPRYALVELLTGLIFMSIFYRFGISVEFIAYSFLMSLLIIVFFIDYEHLIIPNGTVLIGLIGGIPLVIYNYFHPMKIYGDTNWWNPLVGMVTASGFLLLVAIIGALLYKDEAMGLGDVKIYAPIGLFLGWKLVIVALFSTILVSGLFSLILMILKLKDRKGTIPLGPFIVIGAYATLLYGWEILDWYLKNMIFRIGA